MHIPDGFIDVPIAVGFAVLSAAALGLAARRAGSAIDGPRAPLLGVTAAGIFAAQLLDWPLPGGTSAHFVGGAFAAILLGPHLGALAVAAVVTVQALVFGDGGVVVLGANLWNMAVVEVYAGYAVYRLVAPHGEVAGAFAAGWVASTLGAVSAALQLGASAAFGYDLLTVLAIMGGLHLALGLIEGAITAAVTRRITAARPDVLAGPARGAEA
jgi:cobalt/nickel transport system permease protein